MEWTLETSYRENKTLFCYPGSHLFLCLQKAMLILLQLVPRETGLERKLFAILSDWLSGLSSARSSAGPRECPEFVVTSALTASSSGKESWWFSGLNLPSSARSSAGPRESQDKYLRPEYEELEVNEYELEM